MSDELEAVLRQVATGEITPEQALHRLGGPAQTKPSGPSSGAPTGPSSGASLAPGAPRTGEPSAELSVEAVTVVRLTTSYRSIHVIADPTVAQIHVLGDHSIQHQGSALIISAAGPLDSDHDQLEHAGQTARHSGHFSFSDLPRTIAWARSWREHQLTVRVNPALRVELDVTGAEVKVTGVHTGLRARLVASALRGDKLTGTLDVEAASSSVKLTGVPTGDSRIACESSSVRLSLSAGSDLKITATNRMGRLVLPERPPSTLPFEGETSEVTIGDGRDRLLLESVMSSVTVTIQAWAAPV